MSVTNLHSMDSQTTPPFLSNPLRVRPEDIHLGRMHPVFIDRTRQIYRTWKIPPSIVIPMHHLKVLHEVDLAMTRLQHMNYGFASMAKYDYRKTGVALTLEMIKLAEERVQWGLRISVSLGNILISLYQLTALHHCDMNKDLDVMVMFLLPLAEHLKLVWVSYRRMFPPLGKDRQGPRQILEPEVEGFTNIVVMTEAWVKQQVTPTGKWWPDIHQGGLGRMQQTQHNLQRPTNTAAQPAQVFQQNSAKLEEQPQATQASNPIVRRPAEAVTQALGESQYSRRAAATDNAHDAPETPPKPTQPRQRRPESPKIRRARPQRRPENPRTPIQRSRGRLPMSKELEKHLQGLSQSSQGGSQTLQRLPQTTRQLPPNFRRPLVPSRGFDIPPQPLPQGFGPLPPNFQGPLVPTQWLDGPPKAPSAMPGQPPSNSQGPLEHSRRLAQLRQQFPHAGRQLPENFQGPLHSSQETSQPAQEEAPVLPVKVSEELFEPSLGSRSDEMGFVIDTTVDASMDTTVETLEEEFPWDAQWFLPTPPGT